MRKTTGTLLATLLLAATGGSALSAEVTVMISGGFKAALEKLAPAWEKRSGVVPWHVVLRGEGRLNVGGQTHHLRAGDVILLPHGSPHLMESLVEWGQVLPVAHRFNGTVTEMRAGPAEGGAGDAVRRILFLVRTSAGCSVKHRR